MVAVKDGQVYLSAFEKVQSDSFLDHPASQTIMVKALVRRLNILIPLTVGIFKIQTQVHQRFAMAVVTLINAMQTVTVRIQAVTTAIHLS